MSRIQTGMIVVASALAMSAFVGCKVAEGNTPSQKFHSRMRAKPAELSSFLPHHELLEKQPNTFPFHYFYLKKDAPVYDRIYVAPVDTSVLRTSSGWGEFDKALAGKLGSDIDDLAAYMHKAYRQAFRKSGHVKPLEVVDSRDQPNTLVLETAIISVVPTKAELNAIGMAANFVVPGIGILSSALSGGSITVECRIRDAKTGELVSMYATTETDPRAILSATRFTWLTSAQINIKQIAAYSSSVYYAARDYRQIHRKFPISWTSLIKDANLDDEPKTDDVK